MARSRILIVARDPGVGAGLEKRAEGLGYEVVAIAAVDDVTELVAATSPDLLLVGIGHDGSAAAVALAESIRRQVPTPAVFLGPGSAEAGLAHATVKEPYGYVDAAADDEALRLALEHALGLGTELRASHDLDAFFALSLDMFAFLDFGGYFLRLNPAWQRTLGYTPAELMARPFLEYVHPGDRERTLRQNSQVRLGGSTPGSFLGLAEGYGLPRRAEAPSGSSKAIGPRHRASSARWRPCRESSRSTLAMA
jgi:PAS domain-containing protein